MVQDRELGKYLEDNESDIGLLIIDEAHHAAASSYGEIVENTSIPGLWLTATPNRTDNLPIGIDGIAYEITYAELFDLGVIIKPKFETEGVPFVNWNNDAEITDLAQYLLDRSEDEFTKLVITTKVDSTEKLFLAIQSELRERIATH